MEFVYKFAAQVWTETPDDTLVFAGTREVRLVAEVQSFLLGDLDGPAQPQGEGTLRFTDTGEEVEVDFAEVVRGTGPGVATDILIFDDEEGQFGSGRELFVLLSGDPLPEPAIGTDIEVFAGQFETIEFLTFTDEDEIPITTGPFPVGTEIEIAQIAAVESLGQQGVFLLPGDDAARKDRVETIGRLYEGALDRDGQIDEGGLNFWVDRTAEAGFSDVDLAKIFTSAPEFVARFGDAGIDALTPGAYVDLLYDTFLDRPADAEGRAFWVSIVDQIDDDGFAPLGISAEAPLVDKRAAFLIFFSESEENQVNLAFLSEISETSSGIWEFPVA
ncbi:MAG: DUF4214 domain-containing protein [Pikeienuella sp.]